MNITEWTHPGTGKVRRYINDWHEEAGIEADYYNTGNVKYAYVDGHKISNASFNHLNAKVWLDEDDNLHIDHLGRKSPLTEEELRERLTKALEAHFAAEAAEREEVEREEAEAKAAEEAEEAALPTEGEEYVHSTHRVLNAAFDKVKKAVQDGELPDAELHLDKPGGRMIITLVYRGLELTLSALDKSPTVSYSCNLLVDMHLAKTNVVLFTSHCLLAEGAFELDTTRLNHTDVNMIARFMIKMDRGNPCRQIDPKPGEVMEYLPASKIVQDLHEAHAGAVETTMEDVPEVNPGDCHERAVVRFTNGYLGGAVLTIDTFKPNWDDGGTAFTYKLTPKDASSPVAWRRGVILSEGSYDALFIGEDIACDLDRWDAMANDYSLRNDGTWLSVPAAHTVALTARK